MVVCAAGMALAVVYDSAEKLKAIVDRLLHRSRHLISIASDFAIIFGMCRSAARLSETLRIFRQQGYHGPPARRRAVPPT